MKRGGHSWHGWWVCLRAGDITDCHSPQAWSEQEVDVGRVCGLLGCQLSKDVSLPLYSYFSNRTVLLRITR